MPQLKIGIQLRSLKLPFKKGLETAARLGAQAVEIDARGQIRPQDFGRTAIRQLRKMLDDLDLQVCALGFRTRRGYDVEDQLEARVEATRQAMLFAQQLGAPIVINQVGRVGDDQEDPRFKALVEVLTELGLYGARVGALLAAETGSESGPALARLVKALPEGALMVNLDPGNLVVGGFSPLEAVSALGPAIVHVHAKDAVQDLAVGRGVEVPLGRGSVDFPALLGALEEFDYRGYFTIERDNAESPVQEVAAAIEYLRNL